MQNPEWHVKPIKMDDWFSTLQINMSKKPTFMQTARKYPKLLWLLATVNPTNEVYKDFVLIESAHDPYAQNKRTVTFDMEMIGDVISVHKERNVFVIVNSGIRGYIMGRYKCSGVANAMSGFISRIGLPYIIKI